MDKKRVDPGKVGTTMLQGSLCVADGPSITQCMENGSIEFLVQLSNPYIETFVATNMSVGVSLC